MKDPFDNIMATRKEMYEERKYLKDKELEARRDSEESRMTTELSKVAYKERIQSMENAQNLMFTDPSTLDEKART